MKALGQVRFDTDEPVGWTAAPVEQKGRSYIIFSNDGRPVAGLNPYDSYVWGSALGGAPAVWRSGIGVTANGSLVYVTGPFLMITQLAALLVRAGAILDPQWYEDDEDRRRAAEKMRSDPRMLAALRGEILY